MTLQCKRAQKQIWHYLDGTLPERHRISVEAHLRECVAYRTEYQRGKSAIDALQNGVPVDRAMLKEHFKQTSSRAPFWLAAICLVGIVAGILLYSQPWSIGSVSKTPSESESALPSEPLTEANLPPADRPVPIRATNRPPPPPITLPSIFPELPIPVKPPMHFSGESVPRPPIRTASPPMNLSAEAHAQKPTSVPKPVPTPRSPHTMTPAQKPKSPNVIEVYDEKGNLIKRQEVKEENHP